MATIQKKNINFHLSQSNKIAGLTESPLATGETMVCFDHDDDSSKTIDKNDNCLERTLIGLAASNNLAETPSTETEGALSALRIPHCNNSNTPTRFEASPCNKSNIPESSTKLAPNSKAQLGPSTVSLNSEAQLGPSTASVVTPAKPKRRNKNASNGRKSNIKETTTYTY